MDLWEKMAWHIFPVPMDPVFPKDLAGTSQTFQLAPGEEPVTAGRYVPWSRAVGELGRHEKWEQIFGGEISNLMLKWGFPKIGVSQNGWFITENPFKMDDLGVPLFSETFKCCW